MTLTPDNPQYESPEKAFDGICTALSEVAEIARSLGINVVFGACYLDDLTGDLHQRSDWNSLMAAGTMIAHIQCCLSGDLAGIGYVEDDL